MTRPAWLRGLARRLQPMLHVDQPTPCSFFSGWIDVYGWALMAGGAGMTVTISVDGRQLRAVTPKEPRSDVARVFPDVAGSDRSGFRVRISADELPDRERLTLDIEVHVTGPIAKHVRRTQLHIPLQRSSTLAPAFAGQLDHYVASAPSARNAVEVFRGEWNSGLPGDLSKETGKIPTFADARLTWALEVLGGVGGQHVLELGPLEGGHTWMLEQAGAAGIVAVEANVRAYLKCLIVKEILAMRRARFLLGDFLEYLRTDPGRFDLAVASGVLYHTEHPVELVSRLAAVAPRVFVWTHYFDEARFRELPEGAAGVEPVESEFGGFRCTMHRVTYLPPPGLSGFCGGGSPHAYWLSREDILACCRHVGLSEIEIAFDEAGHAIGPSFAFVARRPESKA